MKTISIFNEKGGVGKTTLCELFASWLVYNCNARVAVVDFEVYPRLIKERKSELMSLEDSSSALSRFFAAYPSDVKPYEIISISERVGVKGFSEESMKLLIQELRDFCNNNYRNLDYLIIDFPAGMEETSPAFKVACCTHLVDFVAIPFNTTNQSYKSALLSAKLFQDNMVPFVLCWNNVSTSDLARPKLLDAIERVFREEGMEVLPQRIKSFVKATRDSSGNLFVMSTLCWPERYVQLNCPELPKLFAELKSRLDAIQF